MLGAVGDGETIVERPLWAGDTLATAAVLRALGVRIDGAAGDDRVVVRGAGLQGLRPPGAVLDARNSGTTLRLLAGLLPVSAASSSWTATESLRRRPMDRIVEPLRAMGVKVAAREGRYAPLVIQGAGSVR